MGQKWVYSTDGVMVFLFNFLVIFNNIFYFTGIETDFWGGVKEKVFERNPHTVDGLKEVTS